MKTLIVYFSYTQKTEKVAKYIQKIIGGDLYEIKPKNDLKERTNLMWHSLYLKGVRIKPDIEEKLPNFDDYDKIAIGYPIWWFTAPQYVFSFLDLANLKDKDIYLFKTSIDSDGCKSEQQIAKKLTECRVHSCLDGNNCIEDDVMTWINSNELVEIDSKNADYY